MHMRTKKRSQRGFTLVEMIVSVALFAFVMLASTTALLALVSANRKAQALQSVMNNLNIALDGAVRAVREGSDYRCGSQAPAGNGDCPNGGTSLYFTPFGGDPSNRADDWGYIYNPTDQRLYKVIGNGQPIAITAPEVLIDSMEFYVVGTTRGDTVQPKVVVTVKGTAGASNVKTVTTFNIQATAVQRLLDL